MTDEEPIIGMYDLLEALEAVIKAADPEKREALAAAVDGYQANFPDEFFWATGAQAPTLLHHLTIAIDISSHHEAPSKSQAPKGSASRKPETN